MPITVRPACFKCVDPGIKWGEINVMFGEESWAPHKGFTAADACDHPLPGNAWKDSTAGGVMPRAKVASTIARASGCSDDARQRRRWQGVHFRSRSSLRSADHGAAFLKRAGLSSTICVTDGTPEKASASPHENAMFAALTGAADDRRVAEIPTRRDSP